MKPKNSPLFDLPSPIFTVDQPPLGTTLLQYILTAHSRLASLPLTHFFSLGPLSNFATGLARIARLLNMPWHRSDFGNIEQPAWATEGRIRIASGTPWRNVVDRISRRRRLR